MLLSSPFRSVPFRSASRTAPGAEESPANKIILFKLTGLAEDFLFGAEEEEEEEEEEVRKKK